MPGEATVPELSPHDKAMVDKVDQMHAANGGAPGAHSHSVNDPGHSHSQAASATRPEGIPEKFWDAEKGEVKVAELAKSYTELEKVKPAATPPASGNPDPAEAAAAAAQAAAAAGGTGDADAFATFATEFAEKGALSEASYKALAEKHNLPKEVVDQYIAGQARVAELEGQAAVSEVHALAGGADQYAAMAKWALANLTEADQEVFDKAVMSTDKATRSMAVESLKARFTAATGSDPKLISGDGAANAGAGAFQSRAEVTAAMRDPRYKADPAYRAEVERRINAMPVF